MSGLHCFRATLAGEQGDYAEVGKVDVSEATVRVLMNDNDGNAIVVSTHRIDQRSIADGSVDPIRHAFIFTPRGKVQAKGKGEMAMYFVELV